MNEYAALLLDEPLQIAHRLGFDKLNELNGQWIRKFVLNTEDMTLESHRGSYKTTCLSIAMAIHIALMPSRNTIFMRKTDDDVVEIIAQVRKILENDYFQALVYKIYGVRLKLLKSNNKELTTNLFTSARGSVQLLGIGIKGSITGKHADLIITDDIVNLKDRISLAERKFTKQIYMELQNIKNRGGRIINTGTPWHRDDVISTLMPNVEKYDCYSTGLMTRAEIEYQRLVLTPSLFAANYELKHIASEEALFTTSPQFEPDSTKIHNGIAHIDASYGGADGSALTLLKQAGGNIYVLGKLRHKHIDDCLDEYLSIKNDYLCGSIDTEFNADKGYLAKEIRRRGGAVNAPYHEKMNKYIKISTYLKKYWSQLLFMEATDPEYINEIMDYTEEAERDDAPDSLASLLRKLDRPRYESLA